jgi:hypothetical protein
MRTKMPVINDLLEPVENWREIIKGALPLAEELDIKMCPEIHTPSNLKAVTVEWKKQSQKMSASRISGYQIQLSTDKNFSKNVKKATVAGYKKTSKKISGLKSGKKYYVRIRTYKKTGGTNLYSDWSKVKSVKVR